MNMPLITYIVPIYNASKHLPRCIESVLRQKYQNLEIILINDGSKDSSLQICQMYAKKDKRIIVINKENGGVSAARNEAFKIVKGEFIQFLDADDYLDENATRLLVEQQQETQADMVIAHYCRVNKKRRGIHGFIQTGKVLTQEGFAMRMLENPASFYYGVLWNKLYRTSIIKENNIICDEDVGWSEDFLFNLNYLPHCEKIASVRTPIYYYCKNEDSITANMKNPVKMITIRQAIFKYYKDLYDNMGLYQDNRIKIYKYLISFAECL